MSIKASDWLKLAEPNYLIRLKGDKVPNKKNTFVDFIAHFSYTVPSIKERRVSLDWWESHSNINACQTVAALCISTAQIKEIKELSPSLAPAILKCMRSERHIPLMDYVLAEDWGKFLLMPEKDRDPIIRAAIDKIKKVNSDDLAIFLLKLCTQKNEREIIIKAVEDDKNYVDFLFLLFQKSKGRTGGLLKAAAFLLRREAAAPKDSPRVSLENFKKFVETNSIDNDTIFAIVSILIKAGHVPLDEYYHFVAEVAPAAADSILYTFGHRALIWDEIQAGCISANIQPFYNDAIFENSLNDFYSTLSHQAEEGHGISKKLNTRLKVGIIITTYNPDVVKLEASINSVLAQSFKNVHIILIDDNSDKTIQEKIDTVVKRFDDDRLTFSRNEENIGQYQSRNKAIRLVDDCDYYTIQDDDDFSHPDRVEEQLYLICNTPELKLVMSKQARFTEDMRYVADKRNPLVFDPSPATSMFSKETYEKVGGFSDVRTRGDTEYIQRIKNMWGDKAIGFVDAPMYLMRCTPDTVSASKDKTLKTQLDIFRRKMSDTNSDNKSSAPLWALNK